MLLHVLGKSCEIHRFLHYRVSVPLAVSRTFLVLVFFYYILNHNDKNFELTTADSALLFTHSLILFAHRRMRKASSHNPLGLHCKYTTFLFADYTMPYVA